MAQQTTQLTRQDLKLLASQRLTDTPDGGGAMTKNELTGAENELFPPVSSTDNVMGALDARLVYGGVLRGDTAVLHGANLIISEPPAAGNVSVLAVPADFYGQERASAMERVEGYAVPAIESRMTLLGLQRKGSRMVQAYQRDNAPLPVVGQRFALRKTENRRYVYEFFRVESFTHEIRVFEDEKGEFTRRVVKMVTQTALERDFEGLENADRFGAKPESRLLETQIADSAKYYGIRPLAKEAKMGESSLHVSSLYEKLVPTSTLETAIADDWAQGRSAWLETAVRQSVIPRNGIAVQSSLHLSCPVLPGSVRLDNYTDDAQGTLKDGDRQLSIDYAQGVISGFAVNTVVASVSAIPAVQVRNYAYSSAVAIDDTNIGTEWTMLLRPKPARGSVSVSFMVGREWYDLTDYGDYALRDNGGTVRGNVSASGSVTLSLPAMPDSGSKIIASWVPHEFYRTMDGEDAGKAIAPKPLTNRLVLPQTPVPNLKPGSVKLSWAGGSMQDDGRGGLPGGGTVDYAAGQVYPLGLSAARVSLNAEQYSANAEESAAAVSVNNQELTVIAQGALQRGTLKLKLWATRTTETGYVSAPKAWMLPSGSSGGGQGSKNHAFTNNDSVALVLTDNGAGGLMHKGRVLGNSSVDYGTGEIRIAQRDVAQEVAEPQYSTHQITRGALPANTYIKTVHYSSLITAATAQVSAIYAPDVRTVAQTLDTGLLTYELLADKPLPNGAVFDTWVFEIGGVRTIERAGVLYQDWDALAGRGRTVGRMTASGNVQLDNTAMDALPVVKVLQGVYVHGEYEVQSFYGRTAVAPVKPQSFIAYAETGTATLRGDSQADESITGSLRGKIESATGYFAITADKPITPDALRYNAVSQSAVPLDSNVIGINSARLPADGYVPVLRKGDMVVIGNTLRQELGSAFASLQKIDLQRQNLDRLCLVDAVGKHVLAEKYDTDLAAGSITFADNLSLSDYTMPLTAVQVWEEANRLTDTDISGKLRLQTPLSRDYPQENTYVSSAIIGGDLQVRVTEPFTQNTWTNVWQDTRIGDDLLLKLNVKDYPFVLTSDGAISERWLIRFTGNTQFQLVGERLGVVAEGDTLGDLSPPNPATGKPYFQLPKAAFGAVKWNAGNCIRFNTTGAQMPVWILRAVQPTSASVKTGRKDRFTLCLRGDTVDL